MPADTATKSDLVTKVDTKTLLKAARWSLAYLLDPKRGANRRLPTDQELQGLFPDSNLTTPDIENWLYNEFGSTNLEAIAQNQQKVAETIQKIERFESQATTAEVVVPKITPVSRPAPPKTTRGKVGALGVLAELETIEPILKKHRQEAAPKISQSLQSKVEAILPKVTKGLEKDQVLQIAREI